MRWCRTERLHHGNQGVWCATILLFASSVELFLLLVWVRMELGRAGWRATGVSGMGLIGFLDAGCGCERQRMFSAHLIPLIQCIRSPYNMHLGAPSPSATPPSLDIRPRLLRPLPLIPPPLPLPPPKHPQQQPIIPGLQPARHHKSDPKPPLPRQHPRHAGSRALAQRLEHVDGAHDGRALSRQDDAAQEGGARGLVHAAHGAAQDEEEDREGQGRGEGQEGQEERGGEVRQHHGGDEAQAAGEGGGEDVAEGGEEPVGCWLLVGG